WQAGKGPGFRLTRDGQAVVASPKALARVRDGELPKFTPQQDQLETDFEPRTSPRTKDEVHADFGNQARPIVSYLILAANVGLFLIAMFLALRGKQGGMRGFLMIGDAEARHLTGGLTAADLLQGQWWRLLTTNFVHNDVFHLLIIMSTFISFAP